jgi:hypothetical protein
MQQFKLFAISLEATKYDDENTSSLEWRGVFYLSEQLHRMIKIIIQKNQDQKWSEDHEKHIIY